MPKNATPRVSSEPLRMLMQRNPELTNSTLSDTLGMGQSTVGNWVRGGQMPKYMLTVVEGLQRRIRHESNGDFLVLIGSGDELKIIEEIAKRMKIKCARLTKE